MFCRVSLLLFTVVVPEIVFGSCRIYRQNVPVRGKIASLDCLYKDTIPIPFQRTYLDMESCSECRCTFSGLQCCGILRNTGVSHIEGCIKRSSGCNSYFVDASDPSKPCPHMNQVTSEPDTLTTIVNQIQDNQQPEQIQPSQNEIYNFPSTYDQMLGKDASNDFFHYQNSFLDNQNTIYNAETEGDKQQNFNFLMSLLSKYYYQQ